MTATVQPSAALVNWLRNRVIGDEHSDITEEGTVNRLELWHTQSGEPGDRVGRLELDEEPDAEEVAGQLYEEAARDAENRASGLLERYHVRYFRGDNIQHEGFFPFGIQSPNASRFTGDPTDAPTEKGLVGQLMRHLETREQMMMKVIEVSTGRLIDSLKHYEARVQAYENEREGVAELKEYLLSSKLERDAKEAQALSNIKHQEELMQMLKQMAPILLGKFLPQSDQKSQVQANQLALQQFIKGLSPEEIQGIMTSLEPRNQVALGQVIDSFTKGKDSGN